VCFDVRKDQNRARILLEVQKSDGRSEVKGLRWKSVVQKRDTRSGILSSHDFGLKRAIAGLSLCKRYDLQSQENKAQPPNSDRQSRNPQLFSTKDFGYGLNDSQV
jgi:hypothetical protein